jgi:hypothetical protein
MSSSPPFLKIRSDHFEVLQGSGYVSIDRSRIDAVHLRDAVLSVSYKARGGIKLECADIAVVDLKNLVEALQTQRDRNHDRARVERTKRAAVLPPGGF